MTMLDGLPLSPKQIDAIVGCENHRINLLHGAVRSGKTFSTLIAFFAAVSSAPRSGLILITGRTLQTIERNILEPMADEALFGPLAHTVKHTRGASTARVLGRTVHLVGASDSRSEGRLRGLTACLALVDEATLMPEGFFSQLLARLSIPGARLIATTNPGSHSHWLKVNFLDRAAELDMGAWHFTLDDNPSLSEEYKDAVKAEFTGLFFLRNIRGHWVAAEGAVYDVWDPDKHVIPYGDLPAMVDVFSLGVDHGTTNPSAGTLVGLGTDGKLYAIDEWSCTSSNDRAKPTIAQQSKSMRDWLEDRHKPQFVVVDPAAAGFRAQLIYDGLTNVRNADNDVAYGITVVSSLLAAGHLLISDRCVNLIREFPEYRWDDKATEKGEDKPIKLNDHHLDSLRYGICTTESLWRHRLGNRVVIR